MEHQNETEFKVSDNPVFCINGCGFFGSVGTKNMCSKCYKDYILASSVDSIVNKTKEMNTNCTDQVGLKSNNSTEASVLSHSTTPPATDQINEEPKQKPSRCKVCERKVGLIGFNCKCGFIFCRVHHYPEEHQCTYDFKSAGKEEIAKSVTLVKADKLDNKI